MVRSFDGELAGAVRTRIAAPGRADLRLVQIDVRAMTGQIDHTTRQAAYNLPRKLHGKDLIVSPVDPGASRSSLI